MLHEHDEALPEDLRELNEQLKQRRNRTRIHQPHHVGDQVADIVAIAVGSWRFIIIQSILLFLWILLNTISLVTHWDGYPYILLNLALSFQAAFTAPIIMISQNRQARIAEERDRIEATEVQTLFDTHERMQDLLEQGLYILKDVQERILQHEASHD